MKKKLLLGIGIVLVLGIRIVIGRTCILRNIVGLPCPTCGMTRAYYALLGGDLHTAFSYHPLFWSVPVIGLLVLFIKRLRENKLFWTIVIGIFIVVYIVRMFLYFPDTEPLDYNSHSYIARVYFFIKGLIDGIAG